MRIIEPSVEILTKIDEDQFLKQIEMCARNCYKSEETITEDSSSAKKMIKKLIELNHTAMIEFADITCKLVADTGVLKDITRHRHCSFAVESTRYCNYSKDKFGSELTFIKPCNMNEDSGIYHTWLKTMKGIEDSYNLMAELGAKPDQLRMILPHSLKSEICMKANIREWRHIFGLRCAPAAHPSVQQVMKMLLIKMYEKLPLLFEDLYKTYIK